MEITHRQEGEFLVVAPVGRLDALVSERLEETVKQLLPDGSGSIVFDCSGVSYASSATLRVFLATAKRAKTQGVRCRFAKLTKPLQDLFDLSGFTDVLEVHETLESALS
ncbi:MAG: STAS domain-containing protein [Chthoniobacterales bacterium]|jgi:anti-anti-sigma factor